MASDQFDIPINAKNLKIELQELLHTRWGLSFPLEASLPEWRQRAQRALLLHEFLGDWHGDELTAFAKQQLPVGKTESANAQADVKAVRRHDPAAYMLIANQVQTDLNLQELIANERPGVLGAIDTFPCEEQFLLRSVDKFLGEGQWQQAQELVDARQDSFWLVGQPTDPSNQNAGCSGIWPPWRANSASHSITLIKHCQSQLHPLMCGLATKPTKLTKWIVGSGAGGASRGSCPRWH